MTVTQAVSDSPRTPGSAPLSVHPDRLFPSEPALRELARDLYALVRDHPIISPHGHVDPRILVDNAPFADPTSLLLQPDHYVTRLLHANGVSLTALGVGKGPLAEGQAREAWRLLCSNWPVFRGTPVRYWFDSELSDIFGVTERPNAENADRLYDQISARLLEPAFRPRNLLTTFGISVLATTDDPCDDLTAHAMLAADPDIATRVIPTFRPDRYLEPAGADWAVLVDRLGETAGIDTNDYSGYLAALEARRRYFVAHGAVSADHSHRDLNTHPLDPSEATRIYRAARTGRATVDEATAFRRHMMSEMARMSCDDGLVMTVHPGVSRNHHTRRSPPSAPTPATTYLRPPNTPLRFSRCCSATAPTRTCTSSCSPSTPTRSAGRSPRSPGSTRACSSAHPGGSWTTPPRSGPSSDR